jgi:hypothetical protein
MEGIYGVMSVRGVGDNSGEVFVVKVSYMLLLYNDIVTTR